MSRADVAVIDYGVGNLLSVSRGLESCGAKVAVTSDPEEILSAPRVVLPGVGAFADGIAGLRREKLDTVVKEVAGKGTPLLGICLGMQMLMDESDEFGRTEGLGLIPGRVISVPIESADGAPQKIPHIGWAGLVGSNGGDDWNGTILEDVHNGDEVYFVHSQMAKPVDESHRLADCIYGGRPLTAVIRRDNVVGCQFHPEKSGKVGLRILRRFLSLV